MKRLVVCAALSLTVAVTTISAWASCKDDYRDAVQSCAEEYTDPDDVASCSADAAQEYADCVGE